MNEPNIDIRPAAREELPEVAEFLNQSWRAAYRDILTPASLAALEEGCYTDLLEHDNNGARLVLLRCAGELLGYLRFGASQIEGYLEDGEISSIFLREDAIGKGYGHALFTFAEEALQAEGFHNFVLDVFAQNVRAIRFYKAHGYCKVDDRHISIGGQDYPLIVMRKPKENL